MCTVVSFTIHQAISDFVTFATFTSKNSQWYLIEALTSKPLCLFTMARPFPHIYMIKHIEIDSSWSDVCHKLMLQRCPFAKTCNDAKVSE